MTFNLSHIGAGLPVADSIGRLPGLLEQSNTLVVQAPPGTGKTTLVPPALANWASEGKVIVTAPRRVAVRAAARQLAKLDGSAVGDRVGYSIRGEHKPGSLVEFVTPGVLLRRLLADAALEGVACVAIDEVHERQLDSDLVLAMALELAQLRDDFALVAMSATLNAAAFAEHLNAQVLSTPAVTHPLEIEYAPHPGRVSERGCMREYLGHLAALAADAVARRGESALVFVPGVREVEEVLGLLPAGVVGLPLHGRLSSSEQDAALRDSDTPRVVVATSIAESSLTVPGVRIVVDSGLSRVPRRDAARGMTGLVTISGAKSTLDQRAGRAGREGPGTVLRAFAAADYANAAADITPEIATSDLTQAALHMACWGTPGGEGLPLFTSPPPQALADAVQILRDLSAVDESGAVTEMGRRLAKLPMDPRLGRALLECGPSAAETVAVLADSPSGDVARARAASGEVARLRKLVPADEGQFAGCADPGTIVALAYPGWVARKEGEGEYLLASGSRVFVPADSGLRGHEWIAVAEVTRAASREGRAGATVRAGAALTEAAATDVVGVTETVTASVVGGKVRGRKVRAVGAIELSATPVAVGVEDAAAALAAGISSDGLSMFTWSDAAQGLRERMDFLHDKVGAPWPCVADADPMVWLGPDLEAVAKGASISKVDMHAALQRLLPWPEAARMDELAPERLEVPSGSRMRVSYAEGRPVVRVKLQECFGLAESPELCGVPVLFHLLSPAGRPLAVTDDLRSFWEGPYAQVRAEMRGRYPKHPWPEDPWTAVATSRTKNRM